MFFVDLGAERRDRVLDEAERGTVLIQPVELGRGSSVPRVIPKMGAGSELPPLPRLPLTSKSEITSFN